MTAIAAAWRRLLGLREPARGRPTIEIRLCCGAALVFKADTAAPLFDLEEKLTDSRPGFTQIPAEMMDSGHRTRVNRAHVTMVKVR